MFVITEKMSNKILGFDESITYWSNGYPILPSINVAFVTETVDVHENVDVPSEVVPHKYCYDGESFFISPDWVEPDETNVYGVPDSIYHSIIDDYTIELLGGEL